MFWFLAPQAADHQAGPSPAPVGRLLLFGINQCNQQTHDPDLAKAQGCQGSDGHSTSICYNGLVPSTVLGLSDGKED